MKKPISEQVVVITGASSGIGRETALHLAGKGAQVVLAARRDEALDDLVSQIKDAGGEATSVPADVSNYGEVEALVKAACDRYGRIDTWVNNAGVLLVGEFEKTSLEEARRIFDVNFWGELHGMKAVLPVMRQQGGGTIVNVTSMTAKRPLPLYPIYSASKAALNGLSEAVRSELRASNIDLSIVMPASIDTPLYQNSRSKEGKVPRPAPPIYPPKEVARAIELAATTGKRDIFAGPAGFFFWLTNAVLPGPLDKLLGDNIRRIGFTGERTRSRGEDNLNEPRRDLPATSDGGWRGQRYKAGELAGRVVLGIVALQFVRRLARR
jgi:short-subunit dehydrogenase